MKLTLILISCCVLCCSGNAGDTWIRANDGAYSLSGRKEVVVLSQEDLVGRTWRLSTLDGDRGIMAGLMPESLCGVGPNTAFAYNARLNLSELSETGRFRLTVETEGGVVSHVIPVRAGLRASDLQAPLQHLRWVRSGTSSATRGIVTHPGDRHAPVWRPDGDPSEGKWKVDEGGARVDASGGWYDAGDYIKFTLNNALVTYQLLLCYELAPGLFEGEEGGRPEILEEAWQGLRFLMKLHPDRETFIIQVGDQQDHYVGRRLPEDDTLDGRRPALCALSRAHMASTAAALALGARIWDHRGELQEAGEFRAMALALFERAQDLDTIETAFERGRTNDFYLDPSADDQMSLAAAELALLTGEHRYLEMARARLPEPTEISWRDWNWLAYLRLFRDSSRARMYWKATTRGHLRFAREQGLPWGLPRDYVWGSNRRWLECANSALLASRYMEHDPAAETLFEDMFDWIHGRNSWGVSFVFRADLPNSVRNTYCPSYTMTGTFPEGVLCPGPGDRETHATMERYFNLPDPDPLAPFHTGRAVFHDDSHDFMCQELTIVGQANLMLMYTLAAREEK